jgi:Zn-dependent protease with chaperone function
MFVNNSIKANYFDGRSVLPIAGCIQIKDQQLIFISEGIHSDQVALQQDLSTEFNQQLNSQQDASFELIWPLKKIVFPEEMGQEVALISLPDFASIEVSSMQQWREWSQKNGLNKGLQKYQFKSIWSVVAIATIVAFSFIAWKWAIPFAAEKSLVFIPPKIDQKIGFKALDYLDESYFTETNLSLQDQNRIAQAFKKYLNGVDPVLIPEYQLVFRSSQIGPNAFALPGNSIVMTDEIIDLLEEDEAVLFGVFAHELAHVKNRDAMKSIVQVSALSILMNLWIGDFSSTLATVPVLLGQAQYSRDVERSADSSAVTILTQAKISPLVMIQLFKSFEKYEAKQKEKLKLDLTNNLPKEKSSEGKSNLETQLDHLLNAETPLGIDFSSHPANEERIEFFKKSALSCQECIF